MLYHLHIKWIHASIRPEEVWQELQQLETVSRDRRNRFSIEAAVGEVEIGTSKSA